MQHEALPTPELGNIQLDIEPQAISTNEAVTAPPTTSNATQPQFPPPPSDQTKSPGSPTKEAYGSPKARQGTGRPPPLAPYPETYTSRAPQPSGLRVESPTGGVSVSLDATGSWSQLARQDATLPADANAASGARGEPSSGGGVFGLFGRKKGRGHSPKPKERGVLGKEGARAIIG